jgi:uncharacterized protein Usg
MKITLKRIFKKIKSARSGCKKKKNYFGASKKYKKYFKISKFSIYRKWGHDPRDENKHRTWFFSSNVKYNIFKKYILKKLFFSPFSFAPLARLLHNFCVFWVTSYDRSLNKIQRSDSRHLLVKKNRKIKGILSHRKIAHGNKNSEKKTTRVSTVKRASRSNLISNLF